MKITPELLAIIIAFLGSGAVWGFATQLTKAFAERHKADSEAEATDAEVGRKFRDELRAESKRLRDEYTADAKLLQAEIDSLVASGRLRQEQITALQSRCTMLETDLAAERDKWLAEHEARVQAEALATDLAAANDKLSNECAHMKARIATLEREVADLRGVARGRLDDPLQR